MEEKGTAWGDEVAEGSTNVPPPQTPPPAQELLNTAQGALLHESQQGQVPLTLLLAVKQGQNAKRG